MHHLKSFGSGGETVSHNLMPLCTYHHGVVHTTGLTRFAEKHIYVMEFLLDHGWIFDNFMNRWTKEVDDETP